MTNDVRSATEPPADTCFAANQALLAGVRMNQSNLVTLESNVGQGAPGAAIQHETTTPDLEQDVFQIGGCGLRNGGAAAGASGKPQVTGACRFPRRWTRVHNPRFGARCVPFRGLWTPGKRFSVWLSVSARQSAPCGPPLHAKSPNATAPAGGGPSRSLSLAG